MQCHERGRDAAAFWLSIIEEEQAVLEALRREGPDYGPLQHPVPCLFRLAGQTLRSAVCFPDPKADYGAVPQRLHILFVDEIAMRGHEASHGVGVVL